MNYKWIIGAVLPVFLVSCGGGTKSDNLSGREPGILFKVNGVEVANETTVNAQYYSADLSQSIENCGTSTAPTYDNYASITGTEYCDGTRETITPLVLFQVSYINSTYEPLTVSYTGMGFTIKIYNSSNQEVWNSDAAEYLSHKQYKLDDYDPTATHTVTVDAQDTLPSYKIYGTSYTAFYFAGAQNFNDGIAGEDLVPASADQQLALLHYVSGDPTNSLCNLAAEDTNSNNITDKPICQTIPMAPGAYKAVATFNFNGDIQTRTVYINLAAAAT